MLALFHVRRGHIRLNRLELKGAVDFYTRHSTAVCWHSYRYYIRGVLGGEDCVNDRENAPIPQDPTSDEVSHGAVWLAATHILLD